MEPVVSNSGPFLSVLGLVLAILLTIIALLDLKERVKYWLFFGGGLLSLIIISIASYEASQADINSHSMANNLATLSVSISALLLYIAAFKMVQVARKANGSLNI